MSRNCRCLPYVCEYFLVPIPFVSENTQTHIPEILSEQLEPSKLGDIARVAEN